MGRTVDDILADLPAERRHRIAEGARQLHREVEGLRSLRNIVEMSQSDIAARLGVKQPSVLKMERQTDVYLSTLRRFVEAAGGRLELRVVLPDHGEFVLTGLGHQANFEVEAVLGSFEAEQAG